jgi:hypothetical protein
MASGPSIAFSNTIFFQGNNMLQQLLHTIIISCICIVWGLPAYIFLNRKNREDFFWPEGFGKIISLFFSGLLTLAFLSSWALLFIPLKFNHLLIATGCLSLGLFLYFKKENTLKQVFNFSGSFSKKNIVLLLFASTCIILFLLMGILSPVNGDTHIYHLQIVRWTNEYGVVPGVANLYPRFGLGSNWFSLISLFYIPNFDNQNFTFLNTTTTIWFLLWLLNKWKLHYSADNNNSLHKSFAAFYFLLIAYFLFDWQLFRDAANSTSYDFIITALTIMSISYWAEDIFLKKNNSFSIYFAILAISIIPFKLSGIFILIPVFFYLLQYKKITAWVKTAVCGILIITPLLIKNYIVSGYPLYPSIFAFGSPEWQLPVEMTYGMKELIFNANKFYDYPINFIKQQDITTFSWIPFWIKTIHLSHKIILALVLLSSILFFYNPIKEISHKKIRILITAIWLMVIGWFFTAPDPRFAFSILLFLAFFPVCLFLGPYLSNKLYKPVFALAIFPVLFYMYQKAAVLTKEPELTVHVMDIKKPVFKTELRNGVEIHITRFSEKKWMNPCFFTPLPCMDETNPFVKPRSSNISDGFYMNPKPDSSFMKNYNY